MLQYLIHRLESSASSLVSHRSFFLTQLPKVYPPGSRLNLDVTSDDAFDPAAFGAKHHRTPQFRKDHKHVYAVVFARRVTPKTRGRFTPRAPSDTASTPHAESSDASSQSSSGLVPTRRKLQSNLHGCPCATLVASTGTSGSYNLLNMEYGVSGVCSTKGALGRAREGYRLGGTEGSPASHSRVCCCRALPRPAPIVPPSAPVVTSPAPIVPPPAPVVHTSTWPLLPPTCEGCRP